MSIVGLFLFYFMPYFIIYFLNTLLFLFFSLFLFFKWERDKENIVVSDDI